MWRPEDASYSKNEDEQTLSASVHESRRVLLFHISAVLDLNEFHLEFIDPIRLSRYEYTRLVRRAVIREAVELDSAVRDINSNEENIFELFHAKILS